MTTTRLEYEADIAECIEPDDPDPFECEDDTGFGIMSVDLSVSATGDPNIAYLRFDLDGAFAGKTIVGVTLRLVVSTKMTANSDQTGEIWEVEDFEEGDLYFKVPAKVGGSPLAPDQGMVSQGDVVNWDLPTNLVKPNESVFLGVFPVTSDGVEYWNTNGNVPPKLVIEYN